jgi:hypothetical protein
VGARRAEGAAVVCRLPTTLRSKLEGQRDYLSGRMKQADLDSSTSYWVKIKIRKVSMTKLLTEVRLCSVAFAQLLTVFLG